MNLDLTPAEAEALSRFLDSYLPELQNDAARTDAPEAKRDIWRFEHLLVAIRDKVRARIAGQPGIRP